MRTAVPVLAAALLTASCCEGRGFVPEANGGRGLRVAPEPHHARGLKVAPMYAKEGVPAANESVVIHLDPSIYPAELLESATYDVVDGLPKDFIWGTATAAYQVEGAHDKGGRGPSVWDNFSHIPYKVDHNDNGDIATDQYHRYKSDIKLCADMGLTAYRLSLSWSRIMPNGTLPLNPEGIKHYNHVIDTLLENGIQPLVTLYHWDAPQALEDAYGSWLSAKIQDDFAVYAEECFKAFGDRVKQWLTLNEPWSFIRTGYSVGAFPPGRCSDRILCKDGDSGTETYIAGHNAILAHAKAAAIYNDKYADKQKGQIGITLNCDWVSPLTSSKEDAASAERFLQFQLGWFADPVYFGKYPPAMIDRVGDRLPKFTEEESALLIRTAPKWFGLNHYSTSFAADRLSSLGLTGDALAQAEFDERNQPGSWDMDIGTVFSSIDAQGHPIGPQGDSPWLHVVPWGFRALLTWTHTRYNRPIMVTENGVDIPGENALGLPFVLRDPFRINYYEGYISQMNKAVKEDGVNVIGYFAWSLLDNFEWKDGYSKRFGLTYVDYATQKRYPKASANWYSKLVKAHKDGSSSNSSLASTNKHNNSNKKTNSNGDALNGSANGSTPDSGKSSGFFSSLLATVGTIGAAVALLAMGFVGYARYNRARTYSQPISSSTRNGGSNIANSSNNSANNQPYTPVNDQHDEEGH